MKELEQAISTSRALLDELTRVMRAHMGATDAYGILDLVSRILGEHDLVPTFSCDTFEFDIRRKDLAQAA